jgi:ComF family protein
VQWVRDPVCHSCGKPGFNLYGQCEACHRHSLATSQIRAATLHVDPVRRTLHLMKYKGYFALADPLAKLMIQSWPRWQTQIDIAVPIPLHAERKRQRGYNQAELLVKAIQHSLNWDCVPEALRRHRRTAPQVGLNIRQRQRNVRGAFVANEDMVDGKRILLVDDVCTTGSTLDSAARVLLDAGALSVDAYCLTTVSGGYDISTI